MISIEEGPSHQSGINKTVSENGIKLKESESIL